MSASGTALQHQGPSSASWRALVGSALGWLFDGYESYAVILVGAVALRELLPSAERGQLPLYFGGLMAAMLAGWATGGVLAGICADYIGRKRMLMISILCYGVFTGLTALSQSYQMLLVLRFLTGLGLGGEWGPGTAIVSELWPPALRGRAAAALQSALGFGSLLAAGLWLVLAPLGGEAWRYMFLVGVLPSLLVLYIRRGLQDPALWVAAARRRQDARAAAASGRVLSDAEESAVRFTLIQLLGTPVLRRRIALLLAMSLTTIIGFWAVSTWIPQYAGEIATRGGRNADQWSSMAGLMFNAGGIAGYLVMGILADRWGRKPTTWLYYAASLPAVLTLFGLVHDPLVLPFAAALNGFFTLGQFAWMAIYLPELFPTAVRGTAISLIFNSARYVAALGPLVAGWLIGSLGGIATAASIIGLVYLVGVIVTPFAGPETKGQPLPQ